MKLLTLIKFSQRGQVRAYFSDNLDLQVGNCVLADTGQGLATARVVGIKMCDDSEISDGMMPIDHVATPEELLKDVSNRELMHKAYTFCSDAIRSLSLEMKLINVESLFDLSKILFTFTAPSRIDFRELVKVLVKEFHTKIELRQVGARHETQILGAIGTCGMVCCCRRYMRVFAPVTIKMAKEQNLFLNPTKISGICGRLLCCLLFEQSNYEDFNKSIPRIGKHYKTKNGTMKVVRASIFRNTISAVDDEGMEHEIPLDKWNSIISMRNEGQS